jgi:hypothetical protein
LIDNLPAFLFSKITETTELVARDPRTTYLQLGFYRNAALSGDLLPTLTPIDGKPLHFTLDGIELAPFFEGTEDPTHVGLLSANGDLVVLAAKRATFES